MTHDDAHQNDQTRFGPESALSRRTMLLAGTSLVATAGLMSIVRDWMPSASITS